MLYAVIKRLNSLQMNPQCLFMGTADTLLGTFRFLVDSNNKELYFRFLPGREKEGLRGRTPAPSRHQPDAGRVRIINYGNRTVDQMRPTTSYVS